MKIDCKVLANYIMFKLDNLDNNFTQEELNLIDEITIDYNQIREEDEFFDFKIISFFPNLKNLELINFYIDKNNLEILLNMNNLSSVTFEKCDFENADLIAGLKVTSLSLVNCNINNYHFIYIMKNLEELSIINGSIIIDGINKLNNLKYLQLSYSEILDKHKYLLLKKLKELYIDNTNIVNLNFLLYLEELERLSISKNQFVNNKNLLEELNKKKVLIKNENMVDFNLDGDVNE